MREKTSRRLVVDASVVRAAGGEEATHPTSKDCRDFLKAVLDICHRIVITPDIEEEWKKHLSNYSRTWLTTMTSRKKVVKLGDVWNQKLREMVEEQAESKRERTEMLKDSLLVEAALTTDKAIVSCDDNARRFFNRLAGIMNELKRVVWVNPSREDEYVIEWLEKGAKFEKSRSLGSNEDSN